MKIAFLTSGDLLAGAATRRDDAFEHDLQIAALRAGVAGARRHVFGRAQQDEVAEIDWRSPIEAFGGVDLVLLGTAWDYQDRADEFLARLDELAARGIVVCNPPEMARWNIDKIYLKELAAAGAPIIPTLWLDEPVADDIRNAFDVFGCERVIAKRRVGAGAIGQFDFPRLAPPAPQWRLGRPGLIQPFMSAIETEGEFSLIFVDGAFCHAVLKRPAAGDYRVQSTYGGREWAAPPSDGDIGAARDVLRALPFAEAPLYARVDMVRNGQGRLCVIEVELIEPYLFPAQGPELGARLAAAILKRLG